MNTQTPAAKVTLLLVEDNPADARLMREFLSEARPHPFVLEYADTLRACLERLPRGGVDLVLLDLSLPDSSSQDTFPEVRNAVPTLPIIVLSGQYDEELAIHMVNAGAQDYLVKGQVDGRLLVRSIRYAIERKRIEEALAQERDLFHTLLDNLPDRIYFKDRQSRFTRISKAVARQFKLDHPRMAFGKTDFDYFTEEHARPAYQDEQQLMETGAPLIGKVEKETLPDGTVTWALTSKLPLRDKQGRIIGLFGISRDITELKNAEAALEAERNLLRSLIDNLPDYIYVKDPQGRYLTNNVAHRQFLGIDLQSDVAGRTVYDFFPPDQAARFARDDELIVASGHPLLNREDDIVDRAGRQRWHNTTKVPLRDKDGRIVGLVGISRDITERKQDQQRLEQVNQELARRKAEAEQMLEELQKTHQDLKAAQYQLIQAEKMQSLGRMAAGVAHEVKNPLGILSMGMEYLNKNVVSNDPNAVTILHDMSDALKRADLIIMGLLDFSAPRELDRQPENLNDLLEATIGLVKHELGETPILLVREFAPGLPPVYVDRNKIKQVFVNVLTNAIHAMPEGGVLTLRTGTRVLQPAEVGHDAGSRVAERFRAGETVAVAEVLDTGPGLTEEKLARVFDPFFTTKPTGKGTGLGLTVTKKIVELHGGGIEIQNRPEGGVKVTVMFKI